MRTNANPLGWPNWAWRCLLALLLAAVIQCAAGTISNLARTAGLLRDSSVVGATFTQPAGTPVGWRQAMEVSPQSAAESAGLRRGDLVHFEWPVGYTMRDRAPWPNPIIVERGGERFRSTLAVEGRAEPSELRSMLILFAVRSLMAAAFGMLLLIRGGRNRAAIMLGAILLEFGAVPAPVWPWIPNLAAGQVLQVLNPSSAIIGYFWILFSLEISGGASSPRQARLVHGCALAFAMVFLAIVDIAPLIPANIPLLGSPDAVAIPIIAVHQLAGYGIIALNYRRNDAPTRNRIKIVLIAFVCFMLATVIGRAADVVYFGRARAPLAWFWYGVTLLNIAGVSLLAYAVLRQKLFDLSFALNRTLVYGAVSFILLAGFGLAEWGVERLLPEAWHEGGAFISAGIALALFLSFHRLRDWVERHVERVLFSSWHRNESTLRRFIEAADHFGNGAALKKAFAMELSRFSGGGEAALLLRGTGGDYELRAGKLAKARRRYADDDRALALMRAERRPVDIRQAHSDLPGALALPMLEQGTLLGFALLGPKADGTDYRPDEIELLGWAAQQVGFAVQAQHVRELEGTIAELRAQVSALSGAR